MEEKQQGNVAQTDFAALNLGTWFQSKGFGVFYSIFQEAYGITKTSDILLITQNDICEMIEECAKMPRYMSKLPLRLRLQFKIQFWSLIEQYKQHYNQRTANLQHNVNIGPKNTKKTATNHLDVAVDNRSNRNNNNNNSTDYNSNTNIIVKPQPIYDTNRLTCVEKIHVNHNNKNESSISYLLDFCGPECDGFETMFFTFPQCPAPYLPSMTVKLIKSAIVLNDISDYDDYAKGGYSFYFGLFGVKKQVLKNGKQHGVQIWNKIFDRLTKKYGKFINCYYLKCVNAANTNLSQHERQKYQDNFKKKYGVNYDDTKLYFINCWKNGPGRAKHTKPRAAWGIRTIPSTISSDSIDVWTQDERVEEPDSDKRKEILLNENDTITMSLNANDHYAMFIKNNKTIVAANEPLPKNSKTFINDGKMCIDFQNYQFAYMFCAYAGLRKSYKASGDVKYQIFL